VRRVRDPRPESDVAFRSNHRLPQFVKAVSDASPLIAPARIDGLELLPKLYGRLLIPTEVNTEVTVAEISDLC
jgi:hypothetical protein